MADGDDPGNEGADSERVRVPFTIQTTEGTLQASVTTTEAPIPVVSVVGAAGGLEDALIGLAVRHETAAGRPPTCRRGCTACCHHAVPLSVAEAHAITAVIDALPADDKARIEARFDAATAKAADAGLLGPLTATLDGAPFEHNRAWFAARIPCPFLGDAGDCTIYAARPLACREFLVSTDPAACSDAPETVRPVPLLARLARALTAVSRDTWPDAPDRIPLLLAPGWARARADQAKAQASGVSLLKRLLSDL